MALGFKTPFMKTEFGQCRYFVDDTTGMHGTICGALVAGGRSYCDPHHALTHHPLKATRRDGRVNPMIDKSVHHRAYVEDDLRDLTEIVL